MCVPHCKPPVLRPRSREEEDFEEDADDDDDDHGSDDEMEDARMLLFQGNTRKPYPPPGGLTQTHRSLTP